jgi:hypothetical protein
MRAKGDRWSSSLSETPRSAVPVVSESVAIVVTLLAD